MSDALDDNNTTDIVTPEGTNGTDTPEVLEINIEMIVEDGNCVSGANSFVDLDFADSYHINRNRKDWIELDENKKKSALIIATQYIDKLFDWKGRRKFEEQELSFPRVELLDKDGFEVIGIPLVLKEAVSEAAYYCLKTSLFQEYNENGAIKRQKIDGAVEVEYFSSTDSPLKYVSKYASLNSILKGLYIENKSSSINAKAVWRY